MSDAGLPLSQLLDGSVLPLNIANIINSKLADYLDIDTLTFDDAVVVPHGDGFKVYLSYYPPALLLAPFGDGSFYFSVDDHQLASSRLFLSDKKIEIISDAVVVIGIPRSLLRPIEQDSQNSNVELSCQTSIGLFWNNLDEWDMTFDFVTGVTLPHCTIPDTQLILSADDLRPSIIPGQPIPQAITLGFDEDFVGFYARNAAFYWLPEIQINGLDAPGLRMDFQELAIGNQGVSFDLALSWEVVHDSGGVLDTEQTELWGHLFNPHWQIAIQSAGGSIRRNIPQSFFLKTFLTVPFFKAVFSAYFGLSYRHEADGNSAYRTFINVAKESASAIEVSYFDSALSLSVWEFQAGGFLSDSGFEIQGQAAFDIGLFGFELIVESAQLKYTHNETSDQFSFSLSDIVLGELGQVDQAGLLIEADQNDQEEFEFKRIQIKADYRWQDLADLIPQTLKNVVNLPEDGRIQAQVNWINEDQNGITETKVIIDLITEVSHLDQLWDFIPAAYRPMVHSVQSMFRLTYASADDFNASSHANTPVNVDIELSAIIELSLPDFTHMILPGFELIRLDTGDDQGLITAVFKANYQTESNDESFNAGLAIENPFSLDINLPGTSTVLPFIHTSVRQVGLQFQAQDDQDDDIEVGGKLLAEGDFSFRPLAPLNFPFAGQFNALLHQVGLADISGHSSISIGFTEDSFDFEISGEFDNFGIEIDIFQMLSALAISDSQPASGEIDIDFDIGFSLIGFTFKLGTSSSDAGNEAFYFDFGLTVECSMTGMPPVKAAIRLSSDEFSFGIEDLTIPMEIPPYPIDLDDLAQLEDSDGIWQSGNLYSEQINNQIVVIGGQINAEQNPAVKFELIRQKVNLELKKLMLEIIMTIHGRVSDDGRPLFQNLVIADTWIHSTVLGILHVDTQIKLFFPEIKFRIPFDNPAGISIAGSGRLIGFNNDHPLKNLEDYTFTLGLSSQYIFAQIESDAAPINIPSFGSRYNDGTVSISKFMIGYGYTKNSFAVDFAGELVIPSKLLNDADTSDRIGMGVRLPRYNKLAFKLDLIPVTIGKATVVIPLPQFDLDLRSPGAPPLVSTDKCEPYWDGLELIAKDVFHYDLKRLAFSPFFGFAIIPNYKYNGDLQIGNSKNGLTLIIDDLLVLMGTFTGNYVIPIPLFADPSTPYFQNICCSLKALGFEINFNLQHPFPSTSPIAAIEAFGLISDPMMKIDPQGELADSIRFTLTDAYLNVPDFVIQMFPDAANIVKQKYDYTLNLGTLITLTQSVYTHAQPVIDQIGDFISDSSTTLENTLNALPNDFDPWSWVTLLPAELRKFRVSGQLAGFNASACLVLATEQEARESLRNKQQALPPSPQLSLKDGGTFTRYRKSAGVLYQPTEGYNFQNSWVEQGVTGAEWIKSGAGIRQSKAVNGISCFIYRKDMPENICIPFTISTARMNQWAGLVFNYQDADNYYLLKTAVLENDVGQKHVREIVIQRKKSGRLSNILAKELAGRPHPSIRLELISYTEKQRRNFEVKHIIEVPGKTGHASTIGHGLDRNPHASGRVGFYAKNNPQAEFTDMQIYSLALNQSQFKQLDATSLQGNGFNVNLRHSGLENSRLVDNSESAGMFKGLEFNKFDDTHLSLIPVQMLENINEADASLYMGARISVFANQRLRFLGRLFQNGSFALVSEAESNPLELGVFGLPVKIPFKGYSNLIIIGSQRSKGPWGYLQANGFFNWTPIPGVISLRTGAKSKPASLTLYSDGNFSMSASGDIKLFNGAGNISGAILISHEMAQFEGKLHYVLGENFHDPDNYPFASILELHIDGRGRLRVNNQFEFTGRGNIKFLGDSFSDIDVAVNQQHAAFEFHFNKRLNRGATGLERKFPILRKCRIDLRVRGRVNLRRTVRPEFEFTGDGSIGILGAQIDGHGGIKAIPSKTRGLKNDFFETHIEGDLYWRNKKWLAGKISVGSNGLKITGTTQLGIKITPSKIPGTQVNIASLFLNLNMDAEFRLDAQASSVRLILKGFWSLGVALSDTGNSTNNQLLPLASSEFTFDSNVAFSLPLFKISGFKFLPFQGGTISVPGIEIVPKGDTLLTFGKYDSDPGSGRRWVPGVELWAPSPLNKIRLDQTAPWIHVNDTKQWKNDSIEIKNEFDANFTSTELPIDFGEFSDLNISLALENSSNYPLKLIIESPDTQSEPPKEIRL